MKYKKAISMQIIIEYVFMLFIILNCNTVYAAAIKDYHINEMTCMLLAILVFVSLLKSKIDRAITTRWIVLFVFYYILIAVFSIVSVPYNALVGFALRFVVFIPLMTLYFCFLEKRDTQGRLFNAYINIMLVLSIISLFFWFFGSRLHFLSPNMSIAAHWGRDYTYPGYFGLYFERQDFKLFTLSGYRNDGLFTEGPMFSLCVIIAITACVFPQSDSIEIKDRKRTKKSNYFKVGVLSITLLTIGSAIGWTLLVGVLAMKFFLVKPKGKSTVLFKIGAFMLIVLVSVLFVYTLFLDKQDSTSWVTRMDDFQAGVKAWKLAPLFGNGYGSYKVQEFMSAFRWRNTGYSNALFSVLSQGGIVLFSVYFFAFYLGIQACIRKKNTNKLFFILISIVEFIFILFHYSYLLLLILSYCYSQYIVAGTKKKRIYVKL